MLATAVTTPVWAKLSDIWGRKPFLLIAISTFFLGSLVCGLAVNMVMLIIGRVIQGLGGGGLNILVTICISDSFSMRYAVRMVTLKLAALKLFSENGRHTLGSSE
jgi:MFS family permease